MLHRDGHPFHRDRLRYDGLFQAELTFCNSHGIPHSEFLEWDPDDRQKAIAFLLEEGSRCGMCGTADWEWVKEDEDGVEKPYRAYQPVGHFCMGCYLRSVASEDSNEPGVTVKLVQSTSVEAARDILAQRKAWESKWESDDD